MNGFKGSSGLTDVKESPIAKAEMVPAKDPRKQKLPRTRKGRKGLLTYVNTDTHKAMQLLCISLDRTQQDVMHEAVELIFAKHGVHPTDD